MGRRLGVHATATIGVVAISFSAICVRLAAVSPDTAAFFRAVYALPVLVLATIPARRHDRRTRRERLLAFVAGLLLAIDLAVWHRAIDEIGAGLATVLGNTQVLFVGFLAWLLHAERPTRAAAVVVPAILAGVVLTSGLGHADAYGRDPVAGVGWGLATGISYAGFLLVFRHSNRSRSPAVGPLADAILGTALGSLLIGLATGGIDFAPSWPAHGWLLLLAWGPQTGGWLLIGRTLPRLPALETSVLLLLQPVLTVLWGFLVFREELSRLQATGVGLVLGGIVLLTRFGTTTAPTAATDDGA